MTLKTLKEDGMVSIGYDDAQSSLDCFIDIYDGGGDFPSPFKDVESAELFATMIIKLLEAINDFKDVKKDDIE